MEVVSKVDQITVSLRIRVQNQGLASEHVSGLLHDTDLFPRRDTDSLDGMKASASLGTCTVAL